MTLYQRILLALFPCRLLDSRIAKIRELADQYRNHNRAYYGEYLSSILFD
jgi:hypothetical protein